MDKDLNLLIYSSIPKFTGSGSNCAPVDWIDHLTLIFEENDLAKERWLGVALANISLNVAVEYTSYTNINTHDEKETKWEQFSKFLQTAYGHISSVDDAVHL